MVLTVSGDGFSFAQTLDIIVRLHEQLNYLQTTPSCFPDHRDKNVLVVISDKRSHILNALEITYINDEVNCPQNL